MGYYKKDHKAEIINYLNSIAYECNSGYNDGFVGWENKKSLWEIKYYLDNLIEKSCRFVGEDEFVNELSKQKVWEKLKT
jgi:hypothetical protein